MTAQARVPGKSGFDLLVMPDLSHAAIQSALEGQPLFEAKSWQLSPQAWPLTRTQVAELEQIGEACLAFHQALENLYLRAAADKNLLRNRPLKAPWVVEYFDRGKPPELAAHAKEAANRGKFPAVLRPDLLWTAEGWAMTELDSVPGGIGLTAFLNRLFAQEGTEILGGADRMIHQFYDAVAALRPQSANPSIALVVSDEAATYRPEMAWLAEQLQMRGKRVFCLKPEDIFPLGSTLCFDVEGNPERIDVIYRFFELFDLPNLELADFIFEAWTEGEVAITPPLRPFQEEKLALALFQHHLLADYWAEALPKRALRTLRKLIPASWVMDPVPLPPGAVLDGPLIGGKPLNDWTQLATASQKERDLIIKISGFHETAWGARSVVFGSDCSREEWQAGIDIALQDAPHNLHVLQSYRKPVRLRHPIYRADPANPVGWTSRELEGRLRLCPYYFVQGEKAHLTGALATFCPPDKKIIHGMEDAALIPCQIVADKSAGK